MVAKSASTDDAGELSTSSQERGPSQKAITPLPRFVVLGISGSGTPNRCATPVTNAGWAGSPCTFHAVAIVAAAKVIPLASAP
jgi:hypothetical protein